MSKVAKRTRAQTRRRTTKRRASSRASDVRAREILASLIDDLPMAARIDAQREQLFQGMAIVECCKYATASRLEIRDPEYIATVFEAVYDLLDKIAGQLGEIADELTSVSARHLDSARRPEKTA